MTNFLVSILSLFGVAMSDPASDSIVSRHDNVWLAMTPQLSALLQSAEGPVVMHCRSGTRSAHLYAAHLMSLDPAETTPFDTMGWPGGRDMGMVRAMTPAPAD